MKRMDYTIHHEWSTAPRVQAPGSGRHDANNDAKFETSAGATVFSSSFGDNTIPASVSEDLGDRFLGHLGLSTTENRKKEADQGFLGDPTSHV